MTLQALQNYCEALLDTFEPSVHAAQVAYLAGHGSFCQLPAPMDSTPADGNVNTCDWSRAVPDVGIAWNASSIGHMLPQQLPCNVHCNVGVDQKGPFYSTCMEIIHSGVMHRYARLYRESGYRVETGWMEVEPDGEI